MKVKKTNRSWNVGKKKNIKIYEKAKIELNQNEQIGFIDKNGSDIYEICKKIWGFYLSPSINKRLKNCVFVRIVTTRIYNNTFFRFVVGYICIFLKWIKCEAFYRNHIS